MSKSWTPEELAAASAAMKAEGHMSYEEFCAAPVLRLEHRGRRQLGSPRLRVRWSALCRCRPAPEQTCRHLHEAGQRL